MVRYSLIICSLALLLVLSACTMTVPVAAPSDASAASNADAAVPAPVRENETTTGSAHLAAENDQAQRANQAIADRYTGLAEFLNAAPAPMNSVADNPELMAAGQPTSPQHSVDPDGDIGLMEFSRPNETGGRPAVERKADDDIGLMEFSRP